MVTTMTMERKSLSLESIVPSDEELLEQIRSEAATVVRTEPVLCSLLRQTGILLGERQQNDEETGGSGLAELLAQTICYRLLLGQATAHCAVCPHALRDLLVRCLKDTTTLEMGHTMMEAVKHDILAVCQRDPAMDTPLQVVLFSKGFAALVTHRAAYRLSVHYGNKFTGLYLQSQASATFGVDIHPHAQLGQRLMLDHGTGLVIGETAQVGDGCTFLHGVTLGGTGKQRGDRHPKIGQNVLIGANASLLGNIRIGDRVKIGAGSVVLRPIPDGATAVGVPAKIIGKASETKPGSDMDETLSHVDLFRNKSSDLESMVSSMVVTTSSTTTNTRTTSDSSSERGYYESSSEPPNGSSTGGGDTVSTTTASTTDQDDAWDPTCPFRDYAAMAKRAPRGAFTMCTLHSLLLKEERLFVTPTEFFSCFFALDVDGKGYISANDFHDRGYDALVANTRIPSDRVHSIVDSYWTDGTTTAATSAATTAAAVGKWW
jgi:serine O-acetyltransferase